MKTRICTASVLPVLAVAAATLTAITVSAAGAQPSAKAKSSRPPPAPANPPAFNYEAGRAFRWDGLYFGASLGYGWGDTEHTYNRNDNHGLATNTLSGFLGSVTAGYNWVVAPSLLAGIEGDIGVMDLGAKDKVIFDGHVWKAQFGPMWGTARARIGILYGQALFYGTAGLAFMSVDETGYGDAAGQTAWNRSFRTGWTVGGGVEYAIAPRMTAKLEYLHMDFGTYHGLSENQEDYSFRNKLDLVRAGINIKF